MTDAIPLTAEIFLPNSVSSAYAESLREWLAEQGMAVQVRRLPVMRHPEPLTWIILLLVPLNALLAAVGEDVWKGLKKAVGDIAKRKVISAKDQLPPTHPLILQDRASGLQIILDTDLPGEAFDKLTRLNLAQFRHGPLHYDRAANRWRSELDEAQG